MTANREIITVFNFLKHPGGFCTKRSLHRTVVSGAFWYPLYGADLSDGKIERDSVVVMIPDRPECLPAAEWIKCGCPADKFTLEPGDVIVRGVYGEIDSASEIFGAEKIVITAVRDCRFGSDFMRHWEVSGK